MSIYKFQKMKVNRVTCAVLLVLSLVLLTACAEKLVNDKIDKNEASQRYIAAAEAYIEDGDTRKALEHLKTAESYQKKSAELFHAYALLYHLEKDTKREEYYYRKALRQDKNNSQVKNNYGSFLCAHDRAKKGVKLLAEASEDYSYVSRADAYINRGICELSLGDKKSAESSFQESLRLGTQSPRPLLELSNIYLEKGDIASADMYYQQFVNKIGKQDAKSLWLGIRIADMKGDQNAVSSYGLSLQKFFPGSPEYKLYLEMNR